MKKTIAGLLSFIFATSAQAQIFCDETDVLLSKLQKDYGEALYFQSVSEDGSYMNQLYHNPETGSFSFVRNNADGVTCLLSASKFSEIVKPPPLIKGDPV